jgi:peptidoglycan/xylan/chitin deacetylase (PgdA/CDA1 family)
MVSSVPILMYHSVSPNPPRATRALAVHPEAFAAQMRHLSDNGFTTLTLDELYQHRRLDQPLPAKPVVLTFDDGYADFAEYAWPTLARLGHTGTLFVTTGWVQDAGGHSAGQPLDRILSWSQIAELSGAGVEIGAHSHSHPQLDQISPADLHTELSLPRDLLSAELGQPVSSLAYPFGYSDRRVRQMALEVGYRQAVSVANRIARPTADEFSIPRLTIRASTSMAAFADVVGEHHVAIRYAAARTLTAGWRAVRRARALRRPSDRGHLSSKAYEGIRS